MSIKKQEKLIRYERHCINLSRLARAEHVIDGWEIYRRLHRIETSMHTWVERQCSDANYRLTEEQEKAKEERVLRRIHHILNDPEYKIPIEINGDPRGNALKIDPEWTKVNAPQLTTDWGGHGILAPEF